MLHPAGYLPVTVVEGVAGYSPSSEPPYDDPAFWGANLARAQLRVARANAARGISPAEARAITQTAVAVWAARRPA